MNDYHIFENGELKERQGRIVEEFPLVLNVNGREIATLIASPHELRFLVAGFLRLQGFVTSVDDFHVLSVCDDYGIASVRIKGEVPEQLKPVLTSGCGTGITFSLPAVEDAGSPGSQPARSFSPSAVFRLMEELAKRTENYRSHGGIHSAAVGDADGSIIISAEDIGRHNTLDRIAGEALLKGISLRGKLLATSGRISSEMAAKAAMLGISVMASRTSPTDRAVMLCKDAGITLIGYVRGGKFNVYSHEEALAGSKESLLPFVATAEASMIAGVTGIILAGGASSRMGANKALLPYGVDTFIGTIFRQLSDLFEEVIVVTNSPEEYEFLPCRKISDIYTGMGALGGIHAGLTHMTNDVGMVVACDMPFLNQGLIRYLASLLKDNDAVIPCTPDGFQPLHAVYARTALEPLEKSLSVSSNRVMDLLDKLRICLVPPRDVFRLDPGYASFHNINTPQQYARLHERTDGAVRPPSPGEGEDVGRPAGRGRS